MNSTTFNLPIGYRFNPNEDEIYSYFIPKRILQNRPIPEIEEVDLYGESSPDELFGWRHDTNCIYFFTSLKKDKACHTRVKRVAGHGTWVSQKPTDCVRMINGVAVRIGTMRQYTYKGKYDWIMHEYLINDAFLKYNYKLHGANNHVANGANPNPNNIVFCHTYKKDDKTKRESEVSPSHKRLKMSDNNNECNVWNNMAENKFAPSGSNSEPANMKDYIGISSVQQQQNANIGYNNMAQNEFAPLNGVELAYMNGFNGGLPYVQHQEKVNVAYNMMENEFTPFNCVELANVSDYNGGFPSVQQQQEIVNDIIGYNMTENEFVSVNVIELANMNDYNDGRPNVQQQQHEEHNVTMPINNKNHPQFDLPQTPSLDSCVDLPQLDDNSEFMQEFLMSNFDDFSLPEQDVQQQLLANQNAEAMQSFMDINHDDNHGVATQEPPCKQVPEDSDLDIEDFVNTLESELETETCEGVQQDARTQEEFTSNLFNNSYCFVS